MAKAKYQVLAVPYKKNDKGILYCIFKRSDMDECWQFVAGDGEDEDKTPLVSAQKEAFEEAGISSKMCFTELETKCSITTECFEWVDYFTAKARLRYDRNKVALWELDNKIRLNIIE